MRLAAPSPAASAAGRQVPIFVPHPIRRSPAGTRANTRPQLRGAARPRIRRLARAAVSTTVTASAVAGLLLGTATPAAADQVPVVAYTGNIGLYLRDAPSMSATKLVAVPEGTPFGTVCEVQAEPVYNDIYGWTTSTWMRDSQGRWAPGTYLETGYADRTPDMADCAELDSALNSPLQDTPDPAPAQPTVGDTLRADGGSVTRVSADGTRARVYHSREETHRWAIAWANGESAVSTTSTVVCGLVGLAVRNPWAGAASGVACDVMLSGANGPVQQLATMAGSADANGKCLEQRVHRVGDQWALDDNGLTITDHEDWCG